jgi:hypothetical protein
MAGALAGALLACSYALHNDTDYNSGDLPGQPIVKNASTPDDCARLCCATAGCAAFSLNAGAPGARWCYLKGVGGYAVGPSPGCQSGCLSGDCEPAPPPSSLPWFNLSIPRETRLRLLVANMTLPEAISWLNDAAPSIPRLGLPAYSWEAEGSHGVAWNGVATVFPAPIAWGASFDAELVAQIADVIALEARAKWVAGRAADGSSVEFAGLSFMTPNNNLFVSPAWGRGQETFGEDPTLTSALTYAFISALQGNGSYQRMIATSKHFLGYHLESWAGDAQYRLSHSFNYSEVRRVGAVPLSRADET